MHRQLIVTYTIFGEEYDVFACFDKQEEPDFYDVYHGQECINEGRAFFDGPTYQDVECLVLERCDGCCHDC